MFFTAAWKPFFLAILADRSASFSVFPDSVP